MKLRIEILQENDSDLVVKHKDVYYNGTYNHKERFLPVEQESVLLNVVVYHSVHEDKIVHTSINDTDVKADIYTNAPDGHYTIYHLMLPNDVWYNKYIADESDEDEELSAEYEADKPFDIIGEIDQPIQIYENTKIIYYNGTSVVNEDGTAIDDLSKLVDLNIPSTIYQMSSDTFLIGNLYKCFVNISLQILDACLDKCLSPKDDQLSYIRNIVWMGLGAIKYLVDQEHLSKAQQILERLNACPGLCNNPKPKLNINSCGCNRSAKVEVRPGF